MGSKQAFIVFFAAILALACKKEATTWENRIRTPLLKGELRIQDIIPADDLNADSDQKLSLVRTDTLFRLPLDSLLNIPDTTLKKSYTAPAGGIDVSPGQTLFSSQETRELDLPKAELTELVFHRGTIQYQVKNTLDERTIYEYRIPAATKNGKELEIEVSAPAGSPSDPSIVNGEKSLQGYRLDLSGPNGGKVNQFQTFTEARTDPNGESITLQAGDSLILRNHFKDLKPSYAKGYFGQHHFSRVAQESSLDLFSAVRSGDLDIDSLGLELIIDNGVGMDARVKLDRLRAIGQNGNVDLNHSSIGKASNISRAQEEQDGMKHSLHRELFTSQNSNIDLFFETLPKKIRYDWEAETNPLGDVSNGNDILKRGHDIHLRTYMDLPLSMKAEDLTLEDRLKWNFGEERNGKLKEGTLYLDCENGFPLGMELSLSLYNEAGKRMGALFDDRLIPAAPTDNSWKSTGKREKRIRISVGKSKAEMLRRAEEAKIVARFNTPDGAPHIDLYESYELNFRISGDLRYRYELE